MKIVGSVVGVNETPAVLTYLPTLLYRSPSWSPRACRLRNNIALPILYRIAMARRVALESILSHRVPYE